jgi:hypothetical protein
VPLTDAGARLITRADSYPEAKRCESLDSLSSLHVLAAVWSANQRLEGTGQLKNRLFEAIPWFSSHLVLNKMVRIHFFSVVPTSDSCFTN